MRNGLTRVGKWLRRWTQCCSAGHPQHEHQLGPDLVRCSLSLGFDLQGEELGILQADWPQLFEFVSVTARDVAVDHRRRVRRGPRDFAPCGATACNPSAKFRTRPIAFIKASTGPTPPTGSMLSV